MPIKMSKSFVRPNDPVLKKVAPELKPAEITSKDTKDFITTMMKVACGEQGDSSRPLLVGVAAPQIGISKRIILVDVVADGHGEKSGELRAYINPKITWRSEEEAEWYEGCFSTDQVCGIVSRPDKIKVSAYTPEGKQITEEYQGYLARIFQHEIDHLDGIEFVNHVTDPDKLHWVEDEDFPAYRNKEGWRTWPKKCSMEEWYKIKGNV